MQNNDTVHAYNCLTTFGHIMLTGYMDQESFDGCAIIHTITQFISMSFHMTGDLYPNWGYIKVWDGDSATGALLCHHTEPTQNTNTFTAISGMMTIRLRINPSSLYRMLSFTSNWQTFVDEARSFCQYYIGSLTVDDIHDDGARVAWTTDAPYSLVEVGDRSWVTTDHFLQLDSLESSTRYTVTVTPLQNPGDNSPPCCALSTTFVSDVAACIGCPDITNLEANYVRCYYGTYFNPYANLGRVFDSLAPSSVRNRHTVITDTTAVDFLTGDRLRKVRPGSSASIQLGNKVTGSEAEAISYKLQVDTLFYSLLLLHYAVVLENPNHTPNAQPRFRLEILDNNNNVIDPVCGTADFVASSDLGWNTGYGVVLWKDWTTVGFDLSAYHGQDVYIRFTTYDCAEGGHFGYAYFSTECQHRSVTTENCGQSTSNTISAPHGFHYKWYNTSPSDVISTDRTITYNTSNGYYHCQLISTENPNCYVTMHAYLGERYPMAIPDTFQIDDLGCDGYRVIFLNRSAVRGTNGPLTYFENCETAYWYFGDGMSSTTYSPEHIFRRPGTYDVSLVAGIANDQCKDTAVITITVPDYYVPADTHITVCDSLRWGDQLFLRDTSGLTLLTDYHNRCDTAYNLNLVVEHSSITTLPADTFCYSSTYTWNGQTVGQNGSTLTDTAHHRLISAMPSPGLCDSVFVLPLVQLPPDTLHFARVSDCYEKSYVLTAFTDLPHLRWHASPPDPYLAGQEYQRQVLVAPEQTTYYSATVDYADTTYCPTTRGITLQPVTFPRAKLRVQPEVLVNDQRDFTAYDISRRYNSRRWALVLHGTADDTLHFPDPDSYIALSMPFPYDSATVLLEVSNDVCLDTARHTVRLMNVNLYTPNAFTPDQPINNHFYIVGEGILEGSLYIYNRHGLLVHSTDDPFTGWDGTHSGSPCQQGAYVWHLRYRAADRPTDWQAATGTVTLLR